MISVIIPVTPSSAMRHPQGCLQHAHCKVNAMHHLLERMNIPASRVLAVGDSDNDICLLQAAGLSVAFQPKSAQVQAAASVVLQGPMTELLEILARQPQAVPA